MPAGRPPIWSDPEAFAESVEEYFTNEVEITWTGLALHLGFESRSSLNDYLKKPEFSYPIKKALLRIENNYEKGMLKAKNPTAYIFALKNFGWADKQEIDQKTEHSGAINITWQDPELPNSENKGSN